MAALALGLLVSSAKTFYDTQSSELTQLSANVILLDRVLAHYGPETKEARDSLRAAVGRTLDLMWHQEQRHSQMEPGAGGGDVLYDKIQALSSQNEAQHAPRAQASSMAIDLGKLRGEVTRRTTEPQTRGDASTAALHVGVASKGGMDCQRALHFFTASSGSQR